MGIKEVLKESWLTRGGYKALRKVRDMVRRKWKLRSKYSFQDRARGKEKLCIILAGYKSFLYNSVFGRVEEYIDADIDVCIVTSGLFSDEINARCLKNRWSYLSTERNHVGLAQNIAIYLHPKAEYIFKLDEDIFITKGYFQNMIRAYVHARMGDFNPGVMAPILNVNGFGHALLLDRLGLRQSYENKFGKLKYAAGRNTPIESNIEVNKFFWGEGGYLPSVDEMNRRLSQDELAERPCPIRFSIGAILYERALWEEMGYFNVRMRGKSTGMGADEAELGTYCLLQSRPLMVSENIVVGHHSFGLLNAEMKRYYSEHKEIFHVNGKKNAT